jgi:hypothetical protein
MVISFDVAGLGERYFTMVLVVRCGAPFRKPALIVLMSNKMGGVQRLWCMHFMALVLVVR